MTDRKQPHPQRCEMCESFHEREQPRRYRCSWNYCDVHPKDECLCSPSHWKEASHNSATEPAPIALEELKITSSMLYEFCEWFCDYDCEEKPCVVTVSRLHERLEGIKKQMQAHPEYLAKWEIKRSEQRSLRSGDAP